MRLRDGAPFEPDIVANTLLRLTAPVCERLCELADRCRPWRPALPQLTRVLRESLAEGGVPAGQARVRLVLRRGLTGGGMTEGQTASLGSFLDTS